MRGSFPETPLPSTDLSPEPQPRSGSDHWDSETSRRETGERRSHTAGRADTRDRTASTLEAPYGQRTHLQQAPAYWHGSIGNRRHESRTLCHAKGPKAESCVRSRRMTLWLSHSVGSLPTRQGPPGDLLPRDSSPARCD